MILPSDLHLIIGPSAGGRFILSSRRHKSVRQSSCKLDFRRPPYQGLRSGVRHLSRMTSSHLQDCASCITGKLPTSKGAMLPPLPVNSLHISPHPRITTSWLAVSGSFSLTHCDCTHTSSKLQNTILSTLCRCREHHACATLEKRYLIFAGALCFSLHNDMHLCAR